MRPIQRIISTGFATAAIAAASMPAMSWTVWPDVDFEWYANVGRPAATTQTVRPYTVQDSRDAAVLPNEEGRVEIYPTTPQDPQDSSDRPLPASQPEARRAPSLPDSELVSPTLPYSGSNRR